MSVKRKLAKLLFCLALGFSSMSGFPMDPKQIEELLHLMNDAKVEIAVPDHKGNDDPNLPTRPSRPTKSQS